MNDKPNSALGGPPPASGTTLGPKLWSWVKGRFVPAVIGIAAFVAALAGIFKYFPPIGNSALHHFDSLIAGAVKREIATENSELKETITKLLIAEFNEKSSEIPKKIQQQANDLFVDKLKHKIGPMVAGRFILDSKKPDWTVDVFWNKDHSTRLWVYVEKLDNDDCILIQPPHKLGYPITTPGPYHDIDIAELLTVESGSMTPSGLPANVFKLNKGMLDAVHKLTFILGTKDSMGTNCKSPRNMDSGSVEVEYLMATAPMVGDEEMNQK